jgi:hypothetical protein
MNYYILSGDRDTLVSVVEIINEEEALVSVVEIINEEEALD